MAQGIRLGAFDERSLSSLVEFENTDSLSEVLVELNDKTRQMKYKDNGKGTGMTSCTPSSQTLGNENICNATAARLATLQNRNRQLQKALALASVQYSKEIASMRRTIQALEQQVAELKEGTN
ncbi:hypothetical protein Ndes2526B_g06232 [Nannochloris sp. 'desiccata']|nr:hypothetical protein KSW81_008011 [Chlorella desiccata (nom. nud.)]KAH7619270.1 hypothetical protein NADE_006115 [Chlorella desiccata (nom. nud.)]